MNEYKHETEKEKAFKVIMILSILTVLLVLLSLEIASIVSSGLYIGIGIF